MEQSGIGLQASTNNNANRVDRFFVVDEMSRAKAKVALDRFSNEQTRGRDRHNYGHQFRQVTTILAVMRRVLLSIYRAIHT